MNLALNNARHIIEHYREKHEDAEVEIVTYGPGLHMLRDDTSPVKDRIKQMVDASLPSKITFAACNNTKQGMEKREGKAITIVPQATIVPSGVVRLMELQEQGWSYLRPCAIDARPRDPLLHLRQHRRGQDHARAQARGAARRRAVLRGRVAGAPRGRDRKLRRFPQACAPAARRGRS